MVALMGRPRSGKTHPDEHPGLPRPAHFRPSTGSTARMFRGCRPTSGPWCAIGRSASCSRTSTCCPHQRPGRTWPCRCRTRPSICPIGEARQRARDARPGRPGGPDASRAVAAFRRPAAARGDCPGAGQPPLLVLFADEPTGNLDSRTSEEVLDMFQQLNEEDGITIILVTHDAEGGPTPGASSTSTTADRGRRFRDGDLLRPITRHRRGSGRSDEELSHNPNRHEGPAAKPDAGHADDAGHRHRRRCRHRHDGNRRRLFARRSRRALPAWGPTCCSSCRARATSRR